MFDWNQANVAELTRLFFLGFSGTEIARQLGCSRNAILGKIDRMGLSEKAYTEGYRTRPKARATRPKMRAQPKARTFQGYYRFVAPPKPRVAVGPRDPEKMVGCTLLTLTDKTCHFPIGDVGQPDFFFCGNAVAFDNAPYCDHHMRICHVSRADRHRDTASKPKPNYQPPFCER